MAHGVSTVHRYRLALAGVVLTGLFLAGSRAFRPVEGGLFDHRIADYYQPGITLTRPANGRLSRREFMQPFAERTLLVLAKNHLLDRYRGTDLAGPEPLTRFDVAFLLGRFIRVVNSRDGKTFPMRASLDHQHPFIPQKGWGLLEVEFALCQRLLAPVWELGWWERPVPRYHLAVMISKILKSLEPHYALRRLFSVYPPEEYADFPPYGHPTWFLTRPAVEYGLLEGTDGRFRGQSAVSGRDMAVVLDRLVTIVNGYRREGQVPLPVTEPDGSGMALARPDPFPNALRTMTHEIRKSEMEASDVVQRPVLGSEVREPDANP